MIRLDSAGIVRELPPCKIHASSPDPLARPPRYQAEIDLDRSRPPFPNKFCQIFNLTHIARKSLDATEPAESPSPQNHRPSLFPPHCAFPFPAFPFLCQPVFSAHRNEVPTSVLPRSSSSVSVFRSMFPLFPCSRFSAAGGTCARAISLGISEIFCKFKLAMSSHPAAEFYFLHLQFPEPSLKLKRVSSKKNSFSSRRIPWLINHVHSTFT
jgi:hypothetical protein